jgi:riboflavin kinase/FMN adenylyltransferase
VTTILIRGLNNFKEKYAGAIATIGNFDGVHQGHDALLNLVKKEAKKQKVPSLVIVFEPQPLEFFAKAQSVPRLTRFREKFHQFVRQGIDIVLVIRFNKAFANLSPESFVRDVLHQRLKLKKIIIGEDFRFGKARLGDVTLLKKLSHPLLMSIEVAPNQLYHDERISSTRIRNALQNADHALAAQLLGRPYTMMGRVVYGHQRGRMLGFPTANIYLHREVTPVHGVYAVRLHGIAKDGLPGVANVGIRPTIGGTRTILEVHIFNFNENIYGRAVCVEFCKKLRDEKRFANLDLLKAQIWQDAIDAKAYFTNEDEA